MQFLLVYIREAHAIDSRSPMSRVLVEDPVTEFERHKVATSCIRDLELDMIPTVIDKLDDKVNQAYGAWPDRLYLIRKDGKIAYAGGQGPRGFAPEALEDAILFELDRIWKEQKK